MVYRPQARSFRRRLGNEAQSYWLDDKAHEARGRERGLWCFVWANTDCFPRRERATSCPSFLQVWASCRSGLSACEPLPLSSCVLSSLSSLLRFLLLFRVLSCPSCKFSSYGSQCFYTTKAISFIKLLQINGG